MPVQSHTWRSSPSMSPARMRRASTGLRADWDSLAWLWHTSPTWVHSPHTCDAHVSNAQGVVDAGVDRRKSTACVSCPVVGSSTSAL